LKNGIQKILNIPDFTLFPEYFSQLPSPGYRLTPVWYYALECHRENIRLDRLKIPCILKRLYNNVEEMADRKSLGQKKAVESRIAIFDKKQKARTVVRTRQRVRISKEGRDGERWIKGKGT
jgi:hypothetical protein